MRDRLALFRAYMQLERRRREGLSPAELDRWNLLHRQLESAFGDVAHSEGAGRRATPRVPTHLEVCFVDSREIGSVLMTNLSRGGLFVPTENPLPIGSEVKLRIRIEAPRMEVVALGEVTSHNVGPRLDRKARGMGIRFKNLSEADQKLVDDLYEREVARYLGG